MVKADSPDLRLRAGGAFVRADLRTPEDVRSAFASLHDRFGEEASLVVQRMAAPGVPTVIRAGDNQSFGSVVSFGLADVTAELLDDRSFRLAPLTDVDAADLIHAVRAAPLLFGLPAGATSLAEQPNVEALEELLIRVSRLVEAFPEVGYVDLDPVLVKRHRRPRAGRAHVAARGPRGTAGRRSPATARGDVLIMGWASRFTFRSRTVTGRRQDRGMRKTRAVSTDWRLEIERSGYYPALVIDASPMSLVTRAPRRSSCTTRRPSTRPWRCGGTSP